MNGLLPGDSRHFYTWLAIDSVFAVLYSVLFAWLLRWRAANATDGWSFAGRFLSWITALAVLFDLAENAILWTAASTAAADVSPWLSQLVWLKWLSLGIVVCYFAAWAVALRTRVPSDPRPPDSL